MVVYLRPTSGGEGSHSLLPERYNASHDDLTDGIPLLYSTMRPDSQTYGWLLPTVDARVEIRQVALPP